MRRLLVPGVVVGCLAALLFACYGRALFRGEQFAYRDAAHYYYPLYERVQAEWRQGKLPLWEPEENGGMPLLGNPTAAVLYPGKLLFAVAPYPWGMRLYVVGHTLLAFVALFALLRTLQVSVPGAGLGALAYAFGGPILFQYCNIIYLVGAAWAPFGIRAVHLWLCQGKRFGLLELAAVLALESLGGDPEVAYLTGVAAGLYALILSRGRRVDTERAAGAPEPKPLGWVWIPALAALVVVWVAATLGMERLAVAVREHAVPPVRLPWMRWVPLVVNGSWGAIGVWLLLRYRRGGNDAVRWLVPMLMGLVVAAGLAGALAAAQLFPVMEFTRLTGRSAGEGPHDVFPFSLHPFRVVEFLWPNVFGTPFQGSNAWATILPPAAKEVKIWVPSVYVGGLTLLLALAAARLGTAAKTANGAGWRVWMTLVGLGSLLLAFGECSGPLFWARFHPALAAELGPHDLAATLPIRLDDHLRDGDGSLYWLMATLLPGFKQFRFPSKTLTFTVLALAALAGAGFDDLMAGDRTTRRRFVVWGVLSLGSTLLALGAVGLWRAEILSWLTHLENPSAFGPFDGKAAFREGLTGLIQGVVVVAASLALAGPLGRRPKLAVPLALVLLSADLLHANARFIVTVPQNLMEGTPLILQVIRDAEARKPASSPFRIHRQPMWNPPGWIENPSKDRVRDFVEWERETIQPKYAINDQASYTFTLGVAELVDYEFFFGGFPRAANPGIAASLGMPVGSEVIYYPRRSYDMWATRYFVLPYIPRWSDEHRGIASFFHDTERVYPPPDRFRQRGGAEEEAFARDHDVQVLRNLNAFPRAWVVHSGRFLPALEGLGFKERARAFEEILFQNDPVWRDPGRVVHDPHTLAWFEQPDQPALRPFLRNTPHAPSEEVKVLAQESDRLELEANLITPGMVVLAEVFYPGWELTIDGKPAPIYRTNRMMRGAGVEPGKHRLVFTYRPRSVRAGLAVSALGLLAFLILAAWFVRHPYSPTVASSASPSLELP